MLRRYTSGGGGGGGGGRERGEGGREGKEGEMGRRERITFYSLHYYYLLSIRGEMGQQSQYFILLILTPTLNSLFNYGLRLNKRN